MQLVRIVIMSLDVSVCPTMKSAHVHSAALFSYLLTFPSLQSTHGSSTTQHTAHTWRQGLERKKCLVKESTLKAYSFRKYFSKNPFKLMICMSRISQILFDPLGVLLPLSCFLLSVCAFAVLTFFSCLH